MLLAAPAGSSPAPLGVAALRASLKATTPTALADLYARFAAAGLAYGPAFRPIEALWLGPREALCTLRLPATAVPSTPSAAAYRLHPALLDGCFQALGAVLLNTPENPAGVYLPARIERLVVRRRVDPAAAASTRFVVHATMRPQPAGGAHAATGEEPELAGDLVLADEVSGAVIAEVTNLVCRRMGAAESALFARETEATTLGQALYVPRWEPATRQYPPAEPESAAPAPASAAGAGIPSLAVAPAPAAAKKKRAVWVVLGEWNGLGALIARRLLAKASASTEVALVRAAPSDAPATVSTAPAIDERVHYYSADPTVSSSVREALGTALGLATKVVPAKESPAALPSAPAGASAECLGIIYLWGVESAGSPATARTTQAARLESAAMTTCLGALHAVQTVVSSEGLTQQRALPILFVTAGVQTALLPGGATPTADTPLSKLTTSAPLAMAPLWGFARTLLREQSTSLKPVLLDLPAGISLADPATARFVTLEMAVLAGFDRLPPDAASSKEAAPADPAEGAESEVALDPTGRRYVPRLVRVPPRPRTAPALPSAPYLAADSAAYLITGGLGGFGLAVAEWLLRGCGASRVILVDAMTESQLSPEAAASLAALRALPGAHVDVIAGLDMCDETAVVTRLGPALATVRGVFHAAGALRDALITATTADAFAAVMRPKVTGLARLLGILPLSARCEFVVLFSSVAALVGSMGQASYAAANAYLDAVAATASAAGAPSAPGRPRVIGINFGPTLVGMFQARRALLEPLMAREGVSPLQLAEALTVLGRSLLAAGVGWSANAPAPADPASEVGFGARVLAVHMDWDRVAEVAGTAAPPSLAHDLLRPSGFVAADEEEDTEVSASVRARLHLSRSLVLALSSSPRHDALACVPSCPSPSPFGPRDSGQ